ncbi:phosphate ABC transporter substrate-binding protein PstS [Ferroacidibacillus organovorans]|uniref:Phosphate-binding protein n=1 Tax=Ferroacidibacillus organovorans TaxID=1765683 RepID=A0A162TUM6_9BACL|nr:phosphate ABC transporter substrate-binding protein PstS [Ferroacidibacillus organovorans]KYP81149.1 hypothetical protein AYJ22_08695 [Ferroacidibacillus organovorans]OAG87900.1 hypothetical protein AYW79_14660 [Ferroacidibacillus organovorans]OPG16351.1 phosphate ABC transporter substrate-binding protein PstS [Ferroacidibacillus organovorans]
MKKSVITSAVAVCAILIAGISLQSFAASASGVSSLTGAGSTFDYPFFNRAFYLYAAQNHVNVNYSAIGSGGGIQQFSAGTVNFGASDVPMNAGELNAAQKNGGSVIQIPIALGGEAISYNLPSVHAKLKFTPQVIAQIYLGQLKTWNDPRIKAINPGVKLPNLPIIVVHRSDGSGSTYIFTDFLSTISPQWARIVGRGKAVNWPVGIGGKGNEAVAQSVKNTVGAIGYVELAYVLQSKMQYGYVKNREGQYVLPTPLTVLKEAAQKPSVTSKNFSIVWLLGKDAYPISGYSWALLDRNQKSSAVKNTLVSLFTWMEGPGQAQAAAVDYVPLPQNIRQQALHLLDTVK